MTHRKLRIAWSAMCGIACLLLIALWTRSYWRWDHLGVQTASAGAALASIHGIVRFSFIAGNQDLTEPFASHWYSAPAEDYLTIWNFIPKPTRFGFRMTEFPRDFTLAYWFLAAIAGASAAASWLPWRFSLRTLLIATTLVAMLLGIVMVCGNRTT